jgi:predicted metalloprotease
VRWKRGTGGGQVLDRRGRPGGMALPVGGGLGGIGLIVTLLILFLGGGGGSGFPIDVGPNLQPFPAAEEPLPAGQDPDAELADFVRFVVDHVQDSWARAFAEAGLQYEPTQLVLFTQATQTGCGQGSAATGPFYCPLDSRVYLDLGFFRELRDRFGAPGDFAQAYVIAHEFGHHVQNVLGVSDDVRREQQANPDEANELSIRLELQADCFAGIWAHSAYEENRLEPGDLEEGLAAAAAVGDDRIQAQATGRVDPETWTHGSSEQRVEWFQKGFERGDPNDCNTFSGDV